MDYNSFQVGGHIIEVLDFNLVAIIDEDKEYPNCSICKQPLDLPCPDCEEQSLPCPKIVGQCSHVYHKHCIDHWVHSGQAVCPMCQSLWHEFNEDNKKLKTKK